MSVMNRISFAVAAAVTFAETAFATDSMVRELFPWFEVGEVVDGTKAVEKGFGFRAFGARPQFDCA